MQREKISNMFGGKGEIILDHILCDEQMKDKCGLYAKVTIMPWCSLGYHQHIGESETYYVLSGSGTYNDNGTVRTIKAGDVTFTPNGHGHSLTPIGTEPLIFIALIIKE